MINAILIVSSLFLVLLALRFVAPELFYGVREAYLELRFQQVLRRIQSTGDANSSLFNQLLFQQPQVDTRLNGPSIVLRRVAKIRELYHLCKLQRARGEAKGKDPEICIPELCSLLRHQASLLPPEPFPTADNTVSAEQILSAIVDGTLSRSLGPPTQTAQSELLRKPLSTEQGIELLLAALIGFTFRQLAHEPVNN